MVRFLVIQCKDDATLALRLIQRVPQEKDGGEVRELRKEPQQLEHRQMLLPDGEMLRIMWDAERTNF